MKDFKLYSGAKYHLHDSLATAKRLPDCSEAKLAGGPVAAYMITIRALRITICLSIIAHGYA